jgi:transcriptional regulator with XRE-family HTH domain
MTTYLRVRELSEQQGLNITTLGRRAELAYGTAHALWHGSQQQLNIRTLDRVARALRVTVSDLFGDTEEDADDVAAYDAAMAADEDVLPLDQAIAEIEHERQAMRKAS